MATNNASNPKIDSIISSVDNFDDKIKEVRSEFNKELSKTQRLFNTNFSEHRLKIDARCKQYEYKNDEFYIVTNAKIDRYSKFIKIGFSLLTVMCITSVILICILFNKCSASTNTYYNEQFDFILGTIEPYKNIEAPEVIINLTNITAPSNLNADQLNEIIASRLSDIGKQNTAMSNIGEYLVKMETDYKVNALFCLAVATLESGHGTSYAARNKNNLFGIMSKGSTRRFSSLEEGILYWGKLIREKYIDAGRTTIGSIANKYCAKPTHWTNSVTSFMNTYASYVKN